MSLEAALAENTAAINNLIAALSNGAPAPVKDAPAPKKDKPAKAEKPVEKKAEAPTLDYQKDVAPVVIAFVEKHGKTKCFEILSEMAGRIIGHARDLKPEEWQATIDALNGFAEDDIA